METTRLEIETRFSRAWLGMEYADRIAETARKTVDREKARTFVKRWKEQCQRVDDLVMSAIEDLGSGIKGADEDAR